MIHFEVDPCTGTPATSQHGRRNEQMTTAHRATVLLVILDGWGIGEPTESNAVFSAATPTMDQITAAYPNATLRTSGEDVGLPEGQMGNSEVAVSYTHLTLPT